MKPRLSLSPGFKITNPFSKEDIDEGLFQLYPPPDELDARIEAANHARRKYVI